MSYPNTQPFMEDKWRDAAGSRNLQVRNPATGLVIGQVAHAAERVEIMFGPRTAGMV